jgi:ATP/maltotriose-dependent transcriptional regulator MalT/DNA-binding SARP family transcriptional activator
MVRSARVAAARPILRRRLLRRLEGEWKIVVLSAPAGYGKSTLVRQFVPGRRCIWTTLEADDRDTAHMLGSLIAAGLRGRPPIGARTVRLFRARRDMERDGGLLTSSFLDELIPRRGERFVVIENAHLLSDARESVAWLRNLIEESGQRVRFILTCRGACPLPLARFEVQGGVVRLDRDDLDLDKAEKNLLLRRLRGAPIPRADFGGIEEMIGGWPAGWSLITRPSSPAARRGISRARLADEAHGSGGEARDGGARDIEGMREMIFGFLAEEVLSPLPTRLQTDLCKSALIEDLDPEALEAILGRVSAREVLGEARRLGLLGEEVAAAAAPAPVPARFHPLFRGFLRKRFFLDVTERERARVAAVAARHYLKRGEIARAARVHRAAGDDPAAVRLIERRLASRPRTETPDSLGPLAAEILRDASAVDSALRSVGTLHAAAVHALATGHPGDAARWSAECRAIVLRERRYAALPMIIQCEKTAAHITGRITEMAALLDDLLASLPPAEKRVRGIVMTHAASLRLYGGDPATARRMLTAARGLLAGRGSAVDRARVRENEANILFSEGRWDQYVAIIRDVLAVYRRSGHHARTQSFLINLAEAHVYLGREDEALRLLNEAEGLLSRTVLRDATVGIAVGRARAQMDLGEFDAAALCLDAAAEGAERLGSRYYGNQVSIWRGVLERRRGRLRQAVAHLDQGIERFGGSAPHWVNLARMERALALGLLRKEAIDGALRDLDACRRTSIRFGDPKEAARNRLYAARLLQLRMGSYRPVLLQALRALQSSNHMVALRKERDVSEPLLMDLAPGLPGNLRDSVRAFGIGPAGRPDPGAREMPKRDRRPALPRSGPISIRLLGGCEIEVGGADVHVPRRASLELIARLALRPGEPLPREVLAESLWPGAEAAVSRNRFDVALNAARRALEPHAGTRGPFAILRLDGGLCILERNLVRVDVAEFEKAAGRCEGPLAQIERLRRGGRRPTSRDVARPALAALRDAAGRYGGELLPQLRYAEWTQIDRERLRELHTRILFGIGIAALLLGDAADAIVTARRLLAQDPYHEDAELLLIESLAAKGERLAVARSYESFERRIKTSLGFSPGPELKAAYQRAMGSS